MNKQLEKLFEQISLREGELNPAYLKSRIGTIEQSVYEFGDITASVFRSLRKESKNETLTPNRISQLKTYLDEEFDHFTEVVKTNLDWIAYSMRNIIG